VFVKPITSFVHHRVGLSMMPLAVELLCRIWVDTGLEVVFGFISKATAADDRV
jgi:hypothetical protein